MYLSNQENAFHRPLYLSRLNVPSPGRGPIANLRHNLQRIGRSLYGGRRSGNTNHIVIVKQTPPLRPIVIPVPISSGLPFRLPLPFPTRKSFLLAVEFLQDSNRSRLSFFFQCSLLIRLKLEIQREPVLLSRVFLA